MQLDDPSRSADHSAVIWNVVHDNERICANLDIIADRYRTQECGAGTNEYIISDGRMPFASVFACSAEGHVVEHYAVVTYLCGLPDDYTGSVIDEEVLSDSGSGMNFHSGPETGNY